MNLRKRGLGRGLEALLADESAKEQKQQSQTVQSVEYQSSKAVSQDEAQVIEAVDDRAAIVGALFKNIQKENLLLLEEAETLRKLIAEFEAIVRADLA
ncbi:MAG: hypothetical protein Q8L79_03765 [Methylobacter sp.]|uniref:hypothetical protein n=1 Tax=Methylobacter sp. TaxID=2051955 RepID=UPI00272EEEC8|nr:hypothetical protein [Methylobacter sp.]MDP1664221.1 hypothetical protein [Methylobacter sp.]MDP1969564.1 hypothetical protein [Methylobacter sp.]